MEKKYKEIGNRLKILRGNKTQGQFASENKTTLRAYQYYESGERKPDLNFIKEVSARCGKSSDWIMFGKEAALPSYADAPWHPAAALIPIPDDTSQGIDPAIQAMADIKEIFDSGDPILIPAIQANLHAFKRALLRERQFEQILKENEELNDRITKLENLYSELKNQLETLKAENLTLTTENNRLKATHEAKQDGEHGDLAPTEKKAM